MYAIAFFISVYAAVACSTATVLHTVRGMRLRNIYPRGARLFLVRAGWYAIGTIIAYWVLETLIHS